MKANFFYLTFLTLTSVHAGPPGDGHAPPPPNLPHLLAEIVRHSPAIEAARQDWQAAAEEPAVVAAWPDPMLSYVYDLSENKPATRLEDQRVAVSQRIPFPGKRPTARRQAQEAAEVAYWKYRATIRDTAVQGRLLLADLLRVDGTLAVLREQETVLRQTASSARSLYEANQGILPDIMRAQIAAGNTRTKLSELEAVRVATLSRLNALRGGNDRPLTLPDTSWGKLPALPALADALKLSLHTNQDLQAARSAVARDAYAVRAASLEYYPDVTLGLDRTEMSSDGMDGEKYPLMGMISVEVPIWWNKLGAQKRAAEARREASVSREVQATLDIAAMVEGAHAMARAALQQRESFAKTIVPEARLAYESIVSNYTAGAASLTDVLDIEQAWLEAALGVVERSAAYLKALADLERAVGAPVENITAVSRLLVPASDPVRKP